MHMAAPALAEETMLTQTLMKTDPLAQQTASETHAVRLLAFDYLVKHVHLSSLCLLALSYAMHRTCRHSADGQVRHAKTVDPCAAIPERFR